MKLSFVTDGSCAQRIDIEIEDGQIVATEYIGGHPGNPVVAAALAQGSNVVEAIKCLRSLACNGDTSCPGRLAKLLEESISG